MTKETGRTMIYMDYKEVEKALEEPKQYRVDFKEYQITGLDKKRLILDIRGFQLVDFIRANEYTDKNIIYSYYGESADFVNLCYYPHLRLIIKNPDDKDKSRIYILHLNKASFTSGLQELSLYVLPEHIEGIGGIKSWI